MGRAWGLEPRGCQGECLLRLSEGTIPSLTRTFPDAQGTNEAREERLLNASAKRCSIGRQPRRRNT